MQNNQFNLAGSSRLLPSIGIDGTKEWLKNSVVPENYMYDSVIVTEFFLRALTINSNSTHWFSQSPKLAGVRFQK